VTEKGRELSFSARCLAAGPIGCGPLLSKSLVLLKTDAAGFGQALLAHANFIAPLAEPCADMRVDEVKISP